MKNQENQSENRWALRAIAGRGWSVKRSRGKFAAYARDPEGKNYYYTTVENKREAVICAIAYAVQKGTIGWRPTREWLDLAGLTISNEEIAERFGIVPGRGLKGKGWSVRNIAHGNKYQSEIWQVCVGKDVRKATALCSTGNERRSIKIALQEAKKHDFYGEAESIAYLERKGYHDLIPLARTTKTRSA